MIWPHQQGLDGRHDLRQQRHAEGDVDGAAVGHEEGPQPPDPPPAARWRRARASPVGTVVGLGDVHGAPPWPLRRSGGRASAWKARPRAASPSSAACRSSAARWSSTSSSRAAGVAPAPGPGRGRPVVGDLEADAPAVAVDLDPAHPAALDQPVEHAGERGSAHPGQRGDPPGPLGRGRDQRQHAELGQGHVVERPLEQPGGDRQRQRRQCDRVPVRLIPHMVRVPNDLRASPAESGSSRDVRDVAVGPGSRVGSRATRCEPLVDGPDAEHAAQGLGRAHEPDALVGHDDRGVVAVGELGQRVELEDGDEGLVRVGRR